MSQPKKNRVTRSKLLMVILLGLVVSNLHYFTPTNWPHLHLIYDRLCYLPVILAAYWFGFWGGLLMGGTISAMHFSHIWFQWGGQFFSENLHQTLEAFVHTFLGVVTGILSERFLRTSEKLEQSYEDLREKTRQVLNAEEQMHRTERVQALAELSAGVAHEIRTPLSSIKGAAEILTSSKLTPERREEFSNILRKETQHLNHVVNEFLSFARPREQNRQNCDLTETLDSVLDLTLQQRLLHNIQIEKHFDNNLSPVYFDPDQLKQVLANLINNSIQAMPGGGKLIIACKHLPDSAIRCTIEDSGPGFSSGNVDRIFDPFFTTRQGGTGLGLPIVQKILHHHNASIEASNRQEGGAQFTILFPPAKDKHQ